MHRTILGPSPDPPCDPGASWWFHSRARSPRRMVATFLGTCRIPSWVDPRYRGMDVGSDLIYYDVL